MSAPGRCTSQRTRARSGSSDAAGAGAARSPVTATTNTTTSNAVDQPISGANPKCPAIANSPAAISVSPPLRTAARRFTGSGKARNAPRHQTNATAGASTRMLHRECTSPSAAAASTNSSPAQANSRCRNNPQPSTATNTPSNIACVRPGWPSVNP